MSSPACRGALRVRPAISSSKPCIQRLSPKRFTTKSIPQNNKFLNISSDVRQALKNGEPVVALETTIYTHGFPYPDNLALASEIERLVSENGAVPAHIGVLDGRAMVGMSSSEMDDLLNRADKGHVTLKLSRRDLGYIAGQGYLGKQINGGTTIAGTLVLSHLAGIQVFATGGLGGVHKGGEVSMDVSADLTELGRTPVALVSSGCKSFLDIPRTLEYLETQGVGVGTFADGRKGKVDFPAFWTRNSGTPSPRTIQDEDEAAAIIYAQSQLGLQSGLLFANPISEQYSLSKDEMDKAMAQAVQEAHDAGVTGFANTPYVLSRIREITQGKTIKANRELVFSNVIRGAKVASRLAEIQGASTMSDTFASQALNVHQVPRTRSVKKGSAEGGNDALGEATFDGDIQIDVLVVGSVAYDLACNIDDKSETGWTAETSNPAVVGESVGGVGGNIATASGLVGAKTVLRSAIGRDASGAAIRRHFADIDGLQTDLHSSESYPTARYVAMNSDRDNKALILAAADMRIFDQGRLFEGKRVSKAKWLVLDGNLSQHELGTWIKSDTAAKIAFEPVSVYKSSRLVDALARESKHLFEARVDLTTPNVHELSMMASKIREACFSTQSATGLKFTDAVAESIAAESNEKQDAFIKSSVLQDAMTVLNISRCVLVTLGGQGVLMVKDTNGSDPLLQTAEAENHVFGPSRDTQQPGDATPASASEPRVFIKHYDIPVQFDQSAIKSVNGAGDTFTGTLIAGLARDSAANEDEIIPIAQMAAAKTLFSSRSVSPEVAMLAGMLSTIKQCRR